MYTSIGGGFLSNGSTAVDLSDGYTMSVDGFGGYDGAIGLNSVTVTAGGNYSSAGQSIAADIYSRSPYDYMRADSNSPLEYLALGNDVLNSTALTYTMGISNSTKRHYAHKLSKKINVKSGKIFQSTKSFAKSSVKVLGKAANVIAIGSIAYDFGSGQANTATLLDVGLLVGGTVAIAIAGTAAAPFVAAVGLGYGVATVFGFDDYLNTQFDISDSINFIKP